MPRFVIYEKATGRVECLYSCPDGTVEASFAAVVDGDYATYAYVLNRTIDPSTEYINVDSVARENLPREPFALTVTPLNVTGIPEGTKITFKYDRGIGTLVMDESGSLELDVLYPEAVGSITIKLDHPHYLVEEVDVPCV